MKSIRKELLEREVGLAHPVKEQADLYTLWKMVRTPLFERTAAVFSHLEVAVDDFIIREDW